MRQKLGDIGGRTGKKGKRTRRKRGRNEVGRGHEVELGELGGNGVKMNRNWENGVETGVKRPGTK